MAEAILLLAYYWYNFMPLARGTAAVGYITILGLFLAAGMPVNRFMPEVTPDGALQWICWVHDSKCVLDWYGS